MDFNSKLSSYFLRNNRLTTLCLLLLLIVGFGATALLKTTGFPGPDLKLVIVQTFYFGASSETVAREVTGPIELSLRDVEGVNSFSSSSSSSFSLISVSLDEDADSDSTVSRMNAAFQSLELPEGVDLRLGAAKLADLSQKSLLDLSACLWCGRCHEVCPAAQTGKPLSPKKVMLTCAEYLEQDREQDPALIDELGMEAIFNCTSCAACVEECPVSNNPAEVILEFRRHFVMDRSEMPETMATANKNLEKRGHPFVGTAANPDDWRQGLDVPLYEPGQTVYLLWIGCSVVYEEQAQRAARAMVRLLEAAGVSYGILEGPRCTGDPAKMMGNEMQFVDMAQANIEEFRELEVHKVITVCAHCFNSFDRYYPQLGGNWKTIPHAVLIDRLVREGKLKPRASQQKITFHDPCYLARHNDIVEPGRSVVTSLGQLVEMPRNGKDSFCCGAGGGNYWGGQGGNARIADVRIAEALATGAERVATACSFCLLTLGPSAGKHSEERKVFDIAELMLEAIETK